jgi:hypothetical protein
LLLRWPGPLDAPVQLLKCYTGEPSKGSIGESESLMNGITEVAETQDSAFGTTSYLRP